MNKAIHIMTFPPHFKYCQKLIKEFNKLNTDNAPTDIYIVFDSIRDSYEFHKIDPDIFKNKHIKPIVMEKIIDYVNIKKETALPLKFQRWGALRRWVTLKRTYSILYLYKKGYEYLWCIDSESLPLVNFSPKQIFENYINDKYLLVCEKHSRPMRKEWMRLNSSIVNNFFKYNTAEVIERAFNCAVRQSDFWVIETSKFNRMIRTIKNNTKMPIYDFMISSEMWVYELWLYCESLLGNNDINILSFSDNDFSHLDYKCKTYDFHHLPNTIPGINRAPLFLLDAAKHKSRDQIVDIVNKKYFNKCLSLRGHHVNTIKKQHPEMFSKLNVKFAVSNIQELE